MPPSPDDVDAGAPAPETPRRRAEAQVSVPRISPWLPILLRPIHTVFMPCYFRLTVKGREHVPREGPVILTPVHRSRWDPFMLACLTRRLLRSMASHDEFVGLQGWFMTQLGTFPVNTKRVSPGTLKTCAKILETGHPLVIFPEGTIFYYPPDNVHPLRPGTAWLALKVQREMPGTPIPIVPVRVRYSQLKPKFRSGAEVEARPPIFVSDYLDLPEKDAINALNEAIQSGMGDVVNTSLEGKLTPRDEQPGRKRSYGR